MNETWLVILALALFLLRPLWLWRFWRAPLKDGEGRFLGIEVEPGFYRQTGAVLLRRYRAWLVAPMGLEALILMWLILSGRWVQNALERLFADCAAEEKCRAAFPAPMADLEAAGKRLEKAPASLETINPFTRQPQKVTITREAFGEAIRALLYAPEFSRWLPLLARQAAQGEFALFAPVAFQSMSVTA